MEIKHHTVDDINPAFPLRTLNYGNYGIFLIMGNAGCISSTENPTALCGLWVWGVDSAPSGVLESFDATAAG